MCLDVVAACLDRYNSIRRSIDKVTGVGGGNFWKVQSRGRLRLENLLRWLDNRRTTRMGRERELSTWEKARVGREGFKPDYTARLFRNCRSCARKTIICEVDLADPEGSCLPCKRGNMQCKGECREYECRPCPVIDALLFVDRVPAWVEDPEYDPLMSSTPQAQRSIQNKTAPVLQSSNRSSDPEEGDHSISVVSSSHQKAPISGGSASIGDAMPSNFKNTAAAADKRKADEEIDERPPKKVKEDFDWTSLKDNTKFQQKTDSYSEETLGDHQDFVGSQSQRSYAFLVRIAPSLGIRTLLGLRWV